MSLFKHCYRILDVEICLESDSIEFLDTFNQDFKWFEITSSSDPGLHVFTIILNGGEEKVSVKHGEKLFSLAGHPEKLNGAYQFIVKKIFLAIKKFLMIHGGVVAKDGKAVVLVGPSGIGKSTIITALLDKGFTFFSDDFCPIHWETAYIYPFPRSLRVASAQPTKSAIPFDRICKKKIPLSPDTVSRQGGSEACELGCLICLDTDKKTNGYFQLNLSLKPKNDDLLDDLRKIDELEVFLPNNERSEYLVRYPKGKRLSNQIQQILAEHKNSIWNVSRWENSQTDFTKKAVLSSISAHEAAFRVIRELKNRMFDCESTLSTESIANTFITLCELFTGNPCYRLTVGPIESMLDLVFKAYYH